MVPFPLRFGIDRVMEEVEAQNFWDGPRIFIDHRRLIPKWYRLLVEHLICPASHSRNNFHNAENIIGQFFLGLSYSNLLQVNNGTK